jgi:lysophospholipase L1-like esterase
LLQVRIMNAVRVMFASRFRSFGLFGLLSVLGCSGVGDGETFADGEEGDDLRAVSIGEQAVAGEPASAGAVIDADHALIRYMGRVAHGTKKAELQWPGTTIRAGFKGTSIKVRMSDASYGGASEYWAILDGDDAHPIAVKVEDGKSEYTIKTGLPDRNHQIKLVRLNGGWNAITTFRGFVLDPGKTLVPIPPAPTRRIEFFGDSITEASYLPDDEPHDTNNYISYAHVLARRLGADYSAIAQGGLGLIKGFALPRTLPNMYDRVLPGKPGVKWDFTTWQADVAFINIMQNDKWTLGGSTTAAEIKQTYKKLVTDIRAKYPNAHIFCLLGPMDASQVSANNPYPGYVTSTVADLNAAGDTKIYAHIFPYLGRSGHPSRADHAAMAAALEPLVRAKTGW